jgi:hypothetical protein
LYECKEAKTDIPRDFTIEEENALRSELENLDSSVEEIKDIVHNNVQSLNMVRS